jgi:hypothetical protein
MGALVMEIARHVSVGTTAKPPPVAGARRIAILAVSSVQLADLRPVVRDLPPGSTVTMLAGNRRRADRAVEQAAVEMGLAVEAIPQVTDGRHRADELVRRSDYVLIVARERAAIGRLLQLADRYAKPVVVVRAGLTPA